jgi:hypothetical protein
MRAVIQRVSEAIVAYAPCGFASIADQIGGVGLLIPERRTVASPRSVCARSSARLLPAT